MTRPRSTLRPFPRSGPGCRSRLAVSERRPDATGAARRDPQRRPSSPVERALGESPTPYGQGGVGFRVGSGSRGAN